MPLVRRAPGRQGRRSVQAGHRVLAPRRGSLVPDRPGSYRSRGRSVPWTPTRAPRRRAPTSLAARRTRRRGPPGLPEPQLHPRRSRCQRLGHPGAERTEVLAVRANRRLSSRSRRLRPEPSRLPVGTVNRPSRRRSRHQQPGPAGVGRTADSSAEWVTTRRVHQPGRVLLHWPGLRSPGNHRTEGNWRLRSPFQASGAEPSGRVANRAGPEGGTVTAHSRTRRSADLGRWGSSPCATGRRLVGRIPRWGRLEIRLGPAWVRYRGTATPETDPPSTFHRPVLVSGRHRARSSRLRLALPRCRPAPWCLPAAMPTAPISPARVRLLLTGFLPGVAGTPARQGACSGNRPCVLR